MADPAALPFYRRRPSTRALLLAAAVLAILAFRVAVVSAWHVPAGDGIQYYKLSQQLIKDGRLAYGPPPAPLAFTRLPGYPLFLAWVAVRQVMSIDDHLVRATFANLFLDVGTAFLIFLLLRVSGLPFRSYVTGLILVLTCPVLILLSCYGLSESLATLLDTSELVLAVYAMQRPQRIVLYAALAGVAAGLAQLVRADAVTIAPAVGLALLLADVPWKRRLTAMAACGLAAALVFAPWPIRNLRAFGEPHFEGHQWPAQDGGAPPIGAIRWMRTWASSAVGEAYVPFKMVNHIPLDWHRPDELRPAMYDDEIEKKRVIAIYEKYNRTRLSPDVDQAFTDLARERARKHPFRTYVILPLKRLGALWAPLPEYELPMRIKWLGLPQGRAFFGWWEWILYGFCAVGAVALYRGGRRSPGRRLLALLLVVPLARSLLFSLAVPHGVNERYFVESFPLLVALGACGVGVAIGAATRRFRPASEEKKVVAAA